MSEPADRDVVLEEARSLARRSGIPLSDDELAGMRLLDYGLGQPRIEGLQNVTLVCTERLEVKIQVLLPRQTVPQHVHPPYDTNPGKEESIRVLWGSLCVCRAGEDTMKEAVIPEGKAACYTLRHECVLVPALTITIPPDEEHWFQAGNEGCVALSAYTRADNTRNRFADPAASFPSP